MQLYSAACLATPAGVLPPPGPVAGFHSLRHSLGSPLADAGVVEKMRLKPTPCCLKGDCGQSAGLRSDSRNLNPSRKIFAGYEMIPIPMDSSYVSC